MADPRNESGTQDQPADDAAGKGIMARVNAPSDPKTKGTGENEEEQGSDDQ